MLDKRDGVAEARPTEFRESTGTFGHTGIAPFPAMQQSINRILELLRAEPVDLSSLSQAILLDPSVTAVLLSRSWMGTGRACCSLSEAVVLLGIHSLRSLVSALPVCDSSDKCFPALNRLWCHSRSVAVLSKTIARSYGYKDVERAYVCGLLHDINRVSGIVRKQRSSPAILDQDSPRACTTERQIPLWVRDVLKTGEHLCAPKIHPSR